MTDEAPALHHLKMAHHYLQQAIDYMEDGEHSGMLQEAVNIPLSQAAQHMNKAREIDPDQVLWVEEKPGSGYNLDQNYLNARILACEGVAALNVARDYEVQNENYKSKMGKNYRADVEKRQQFLIQARDAFEKALKYSPANNDALTHLTTVYSDLCDEANYKRLLQKRIQIHPDDMQAHMFLENFTGFPAPERARFWTVNKLLWLMFGGGFIIMMIGTSSASTTIGVTGACLFLGSVVFWLIYRFMATYVL